MHFSQKINSHRILLPSSSRSQPNRKKKCFFLASFSSHGGAPTRAPRPWPAASCAPPRPSPTPTTIHRSRGSRRALLERPRRRRSLRPWRARSGPTSLRTPTFPSTSGTRTRRRTRRGGPSGSASPPGSRPSAPAASTGPGTASPRREAVLGMEKEKEVRGAGRRFLGNRCRRRRWRSWWRGTGTATAHGRSIWVSFCCSQYRNGVSL